MRRNEATDRRPTRGRGEAVGYHPPSRAAFRCWSKRRFLFPPRRRGGNSSLRGVIAVAAAGACGRLGPLKCPDHPPVQRDDFTHFGTRRLPNRNGIPAGPIINDLIGGFNSAVFPCFRGTGGHRDGHESNKSDRVYSHSDHLTGRPVLPKVRKGRAGSSPSYGSSGRRRYHSASSIGPRRSARSNSETADNSSVAVSGSLSSRTIGRNVRSSPSDFAT
jgi:hypothetical protein